MIRAEGIDFVGLEYLSVMKKTFWISLVALYNGQKKGGMDELQRPGRKKSWRWLCAHINAQFHKRLL